MNVSLNALEIMVVHGIPGMHHECIGEFIRGLCIDEFIGGL